jgi:hypothetical protein
MRSVPTNDEECDLVRQVKSVAGLEGQTTITTFVDQILRQAVDKTAREKEVS